ncbi:MAG: hypothetical protein ACRDH5_00025 [bacterium]
MDRRLWLSGVCVLVALSATHAQPPAPVKNPRGVTWAGCPDHDRDDNHEVGIFDAASGASVQVLSVGDPALTDGAYPALVNVQPIAFGRYVFRVRALVGALASDWSEPTEVWERAPGKPSGAVAR